MKVCTDACLFGAWVAEEISNQSIERMLDIGTGTGLLSLMIAQATTGLIDAVEKDDDAYEQAVENFAESPWKERLQVFHTAVQEFDPPYRYDVIFCNPPFYENVLRSSDKKRNVAMHSDDLGIDELFISLKRLLKPGGLIAILMPYRRSVLIEKKIEENELFIFKKAEVKQSERHSPFRCMYLLKDVFSVNSERKITIKDEEFNTLLKNYYL